MFDHVTLSLSRLDESKRFYDLVFEELEFEGAPYASDDGVEWNDFSFYARRPLTRRLRAGLAAPSRAHVDAFWQSLVDAGYRDDGSPGRRPQYPPAVYGASVLDPDGNRVEAVHHRDIRTDGGVLDHLWLRVRSVGDTKRFYSTIGPLLGLELMADEPDRVAFGGGGATCSFVQGDPATENVHLAFPAADDAIVDEFHHAAVTVGYRDNGEPGERPGYHAGHYAAFVLDPDGNNVEAVNHNRQ